MLMFRGVLVYEEKSPSWRTADKHKALGKDWHIGRLIGLADLRECGPCIGEELKDVELHINQMHL